MKIIKLQPSCKDYLWGGTRLKEEFNKKYDGKILAETWELSCHKDGPSFLDYEGKKITLRQYIDLKGKGILGTNCASFDDFPILIKFIDAKNNLSIQVHPDNAYALKNEGQYGKTEMWYVVDAKEGAFLYYGFEKEISKEEFARRIENDTLLEVLHKAPVKKGDVFFIESGTIHAIGKDIIIAEIQQNSNVTYRVYDYGRVGPDGKKRQLHVDKALDVTRLERVPKRDFGSHLGICDYFQTDYVNTADNGTYHDCADASSFVHILCLSGQATVRTQDESLDFGKGDSIFIEASAGDFVIEGQCEAILTRVPARSYRLGVDVGGTFIKIGIVDNDNHIVDKISVSTDPNSDKNKIISDLCQAGLELIKKNGLELKNFRGAGIGMPGLIDVNHGVVLYSNNINWEDVPLKDIVEKELGIPVAVANDADCAALGEVKAGSGKGYRSAVMLTIGTGLGTGVILNGKVYTGSGVGSCEAGHSVLYAGGEQCTCGRQGCIEAYVSASALIKFARRATGEELNGKQIFERAKAGDAKLKAVVDKYISDFGLAVSNVANLYNPEAILLGGGVCAQGEVLTRPLEESLKQNVFGGAHRELPKIVIASLGNEAGMIGAANLID